MQPKVIALIAFAVLIGVRLYLRMRRSFGRQRVRPRRTVVRITIFALAAIILIGFAASRVWTLGAMVAGGACGVLLGSLALRHTRFETTAEGRFYTPNVYIGLAITIVLFAKIAYDFVVVMPLATAANPHASPVLAEGPATLAVAGAFIAYYLSYYLGVLRRSRQPLDARAGMQSTPE